MRKKKSNFRIVPGTHPTIGVCWLLKENELVLGTFISKQAAEKKQSNIEVARLNDFLLANTKNQTLKIEKGEGDD